MEVKYRLKCVLLFFFLNQDIPLYILDQDRRTLKTMYQAAFRVHIQDMLYKSWQYANKISYFFSHAVVRKDTNNVVYGGDQKKKTPFIQLHEI